MSTNMNGRINKEVVVHIHGGILLSHKKEHICLSSNKVDEVNQKEKNKHNILMHIYTWNLEIKY